MADPAPNNGGNTRRAREARARQFWVDHLSWNNNEGDRQFVNPADIQWLHDIANPPEPVNNDANRDDRNRPPSVSSNESYDDTLDYVNNRLMAVGQSDGSSDEADLRQPSPDEALFEAQRQAAIAVVRDAVERGEPRRQRRRIFGRAYPDCRTNMHDFNQAVAYNVFAQRVHKTELQVHARCLAYTRWLLPLEFDDPYQRMSNFLVFASFFLGNLENLTATSKPLRSFYGEVYKVEMTEEGIKAVFEQVELNTVAIYIRGPGFVLEQQIKPTADGRGYTGGGCVKYAEAEDEIGFTFNINFSREEYPDQNTYVDRILGELKAKSFAHGGTQGEIASPYLPGSTDVRASVFSRDAYSPLFITSEFVGGPMSVWRTDGDTLDTELVQEIEQVDDDTMKHYMGRVDNPGDRELPAEDSRLRADIRHITTDRRMLSAEAAYDRLCDCFSTKEALDNKYPETQFFTRRCRNNEVYYEYKQQRRQ